MAMLRRQTSEPPSRLTWLFGWSPNYLCRTLIIGINASRNRAGNSVCPGPTDGLVSLLLLVVAPSIRSMISEN